MALFPRPSDQQSPAKRPTAKQTAGTRTRALAARPAVVLFSAAALLGTAALAGCADPGAAASEAPGSGDKPAE